MGFGFSQVLHHCCDKITIHKRWKKKFIWEKYGTVIHWKTHKTFILKKKLKQRCLWSSIHLPVHEL